MKVNRAIKWFLKRQCRTREVLLLWAELGMRYGSGSSSGFNAGNNALYIFWNEHLKRQKKKKKIGRVRKRGVTRQNPRGGPFSVHKSYSNANLTLCRQLDMCLTQVNISERLKSLIITLMNIYHFKQSGIATDVRKPVLACELLITAMLFIPSYTNFSVSIYICGLIVLWVPAVWMCQLYFIGCLELFVYSKVPTESTALCCSSTVIHPLPCIYPPLRSQTMQQQQQHRPTSDTSYFKHYYAMRLFFQKWWAENTGALISTQQSVFMSS